MRLINIIENRLQTLDTDLVVLKGFPVDVLLSLSRTYPLIDEYIYRNGKICLEKIHAGKTLNALLALDSPSICAYESLVLLCQNVSNLDVLGKKIVVLENNLYNLYPNPSNEDIPDFDIDEFEGADTNAPLYAVFYSYAEKRSTGTYIQYIDANSHNLQTLPLIRCANPSIVKLNESQSKILLTELKPSLLDALLSDITENGVKDYCTEFLINPEHINIEKLSVLSGLGNLIGKQFLFFTYPERQTAKPREELNDILKKVWNYDNFRSLKFYRNPLENKELMEIPQNEIMEIVISECEKSFNGDGADIHNLLLTAPTGAGKSLLFQLPAIYLAEKYKVLTIIISPLVALMDDQVEGLSRNAYSGVATLNSNRSASDKERILSDIRDGQVSILYLSPELLLSYSIRTFIGNRRIGLLVVDEAHTVTTWGRDFRVDYLFLGDYIRKAKKVLGYSFPIFALTATAVLDPSGRNDMVYDTIRSLHMDPCIKLIGNIRRSNIHFDFGHSQITRNYEQNRRALTIKRIRDAIDTNTKSLVYFPFKKTITDIIYSEDTIDIKDSIASYHAGLRPDIKIQNAMEFKSGKRPVMCATKAYGMGIDVSDIKQVYHHAPSGSLSDYIQEVGRIARDANITGIAKIDFSESDFRYSRRLYGLSTIKCYQIREVLKKLMEIYRLNGEKRNMLISASDFSYIFPHSSVDNLDQNLKSSLVLISNDLLNKLRFHSLIVRPKSIFSKCFIGVETKQSKAFYRKYYAYLTREAENIYLLDADKLWSDRFSSLSFPTFKFKLNEGGIFEDFKASIRLKITLKLNSNIPSAKKEVEEFFSLCNLFLLDMATGHHRLNVSDMKIRLPHSWDLEKKERFIESFKMLYAVPHGSNTPYCSIYNSLNNAIPELSFQLIQSGYEDVGDKYMSLFRKYITEPDFVSYVTRNEALPWLCEILNSLGLATYRSEGGEEPMIFVRINNPFYLNYLVRRKDYKNAILNNIYEMHSYSERIFTYFFNTPMTDEQRWDFIEDYFLGTPENQLIK